MSRAAQGPINEGAGDRGLDALSPPLQPTGASCVRASGSWGGGKSVCFALHTPPAFPRAAPSSPTSTPAPERDPPARFPQTIAPPPFPSISHEHRAESQETRTKGPTRRTRPRRSLFLSPPDPETPQTSRWRSSTPCHEPLLELLTDSASPRERAVSIPLALPARRFTTSELSFNPLLTDSSARFAFPILAP